MNDAMIVACKLGFDVYNALDLQRNAEIFRDLKFGPGAATARVRLVRSEPTLMEVAAPSSR